MGLKPTEHVSKSDRGPRRRSSTTKRKLACRRSRRSAVHTDDGGGESVSEKLEALRNLIPSQIEAEANPDQLFQQTADYIVLLKTKVFVLQKLVDFYEPEPRENPDAV